MNFKKIWQTFLLNLSGDAPQRAAYIRKNKLFGLMGEDVSYSPRTIPLYPNLIRIHNNVRLAAGVKFITHDISDNVVNAYLKSIGSEKGVKEKIGCIEIMDNVFIGANTIILYDVRIGENCIIGAGSLVNKDIPANTVAAGVPCRIIGRFEDFIAKSLKELPTEKGQKDIQPPVRGVSVPQETADLYWRQFDKRHNNNS